MSAETERITRQIKTAGRDWWNRFKALRVELEEKGASKKASWEEAAACVLAEIDKAFEGQRSEQQAETVDEVAQAEAQAAPAQAADQDPPDRSGIGGASEEPADAASGTRQRQPADRVDAKKFCIADFGQAWEPDTTETIRFVAMAMHAVDVGPLDAPNPEAANLLIWARRNAANENEFWKNIYPKLIVKPTNEGNGGYRDDGRTLEILEQFDAEFEAATSAERPVEQRGIPEAIAAPVPGE